MGKVFTWDEVANRKIPKPESFHEVVRGIRSEIEAHQDIVGGVICGSILNNNHNIRSDLDCVVMRKTEALPEVVWTLQKLTKEAERLHVPVEFIPVDTEGAAAGAHRMDISFFEHCEWAIRNGGLIKENFLPMIQFKEKDMDMREDVRDYIRFKLERFEKDLITLPILNESAECAVLKKFLESPIHVVRKIVRLRGDAETSNAATKRQLAEHFKKFAPGRMSDQLEAIVEADSDYSVSLMNHLVNGNRESYLDRLDEIQEHAYLVLDFLRGSLALID